MFSFLLGICRGAFWATRRAHTQWRQLDGFPPVLAQIIALEHTISPEQDRPRQTRAKTMFKMPSGLGSQFQSGFYNVRGHCPRLGLLASLAGSFQCLLQSRRVNSHSLVAWPTAKLKAAKLIHLPVSSLHYRAQYLCFKWESKTITRCW